MERQRPKTLHANPKNEPFFAVDAFSELFDGTDILWRCIYDLAHGLANNVFDLFSLVLNTDCNNQMFFSKKRREFEQVTLKRYQEYGKRERMPWMADREVCTYMCVQGLLVCALPCVTSLDLYL